MEINRRFSAMTRPWRNRHRRRPREQDVRTRRKFISTRVINFNRTKGRGAPHCCVMCGKRGRPPTKGKDPPADDDRVVIPTQNKDVCKVCDTVTWKHNPTGAYFKWCKGASEHEIHAFAGKLKASEVRRFARARPRGLHAPQGGRRERSWSNSRLTSPDNNGRLLAQSHSFACQRRVEVSVWTTRVSRGIAKCET